MTTLEEQNQQIEDAIGHFQQTYQEYKNCSQQMRKVKANEVEQQQAQLEELFRTYGEIERATAFKQPETRARHKKSADLFGSLKNEYRNSKKSGNVVKNQEDDLRSRAVAVNNGYVGQTEELRDINRKVEEAAVKVQMNTEAVQNQDMHLAQVEQNLTYVQSKAETAGQLVANMRDENKKKIKILIWIFIGLGVVNLGLGIADLIMFLNKKQ